MRARAAYVLGRAARMTPDQGVVMVERNAVCASREFLCATIKATLERGGLLGLADRRGGLCH
jgi:hypothetical protein